MQASIFNSIFFLHVNQTFGSINIIETTEYLFVVVRVFIFWIECMLDFRMGEDGKKKTIKINSLIKTNNKKE